MENKQDLSSDLELLRGIAAEAPPVACNLIAMFIEQAPALLEELTTAMAERNSAEGKASAHALKGVCLNLGLNTMADHCKKLELAFTGEQFDEATALMQGLQATFLETQKALQALSDAHCD